MKNIIFLVAVRFGERKDRRYRKEDILKLLNKVKNDQGRNTKLI